MVEMPLIDAAKCDGCGLCLAVCGCHAIEIVENVARIVETDQCGWCLECEVVCPTGAIACPYEIVTEE
jgi:MinD superfamily P-loop ATPase